MIKKRLILAVLLMPVLIVLAGYIAWPLWIPSLIRAVLADHQIQLLHIDIARPGWRDLDIDDLAMTYRTGGYDVTLNSADIRLNYTWPQLLQGRLETLTMPTASIQLVTEPQQQLVSAKPLALPLIFPSAVFSQLPLKKLDVEALELRLPDDAVYQILTASLHVTSKQLQLQLTNSPTSTGVLPDLLLMLKADSQNQIKLQLKQGDGEVLALQSQLDNSANAAQQSLQLQGHLNLDLQAGSELLKQLGLLDSGYLLTGKAQLEWQTTLPEIIAEDSWQHQLITAKLNSQGSIVVPQYSGQAQFDIKAHVQINESAVTINLPIFKVNGTVDLNKELSPWLASDAGNDLPVKIILTLDTQFHANLNAATFDMQKGAAELSLGGSNAPIAVRMQLKSLSLQADKQWRLQTHFTTQLALDEIKQPQLSASTLAFTGAGQVNLTAETLRLQFEADSSLQGKNIKSQQARVDTLHISMPQAFDVTLQDKKLMVPELELDIAGTQLYWQQQSGQFAQALLQFKDLLLDLENPSQVSVQLDSQVTGLQVATGDLQLKPLALRGSWLVDKHVLSGTLTLNDKSDVLDIKGQLKHSFASGRGRFKSQLQTMEFSKNRTFFPKLFKSWPYPSDLFAGQLEMNSTLSWDSSEQELTTWLQADGQLEDIGGFYGTNLFHGLATELTIDAPLADLNVQAKQFTLESLDVGIVVENITFSLQSTLDRLQVNNFQAELFGGRVSQKNITYDISQDKNELLLQLTDIELSEILALELGIKGSGILDGQLPIKVSSAGFSMTQGWVQAQPPGGIIKYQSTKAVTSAATNLGVGFALNALRNFHYQLLDVKVDYAEDGQLQLDATLLGRNPDLAEPRSVRFNINIQENIPALIKSLKLSQDIGDDIERRLEALINKKQETNP